ncbi:hypothetical protein ACKKBG_A06090 [Auxenochlorella protothecoides x Auxenochlorella symbiontica]
MSEYDWTDLLSSQSWEPDLEPLGPCPAPEAHLPHPPSALASCQEDDEDLSPPASTILNPATQPLIAGPPSDLPVALDAEPVPSTGRSTTCTAKTAEERVARQRERNKLAQKRYRARKQAASQARGMSLAQAREALVAARAEAAVLASQHGILERLLAVHDASLSILGEHRNHSACPACNYAEPGITPGQLAVLHAVCGDGERWRGWALGPDDARHFAALSPEVVTERWLGRRRTLVDVCDQLVQRGGRCPALEAHLQSVLDEGRLLMWRVAHYLPGRLAEVGRMRRDAPSDHWENVVRRLGLTRDQGCACLAVAQAARRQVSSVRGRGQGQEVDSEGWEMGGLV